MQQLEMPPQPSWWGRNWKWVVPVGCLTPLIVCGGLISLIVMLVFGVLRNSEVYEQSLARVQGHPEVQAALGTPLEPGLLVTGSINITGSSGHAEISYPVAGPRGSATVHAAADLTAGTWVFTSIVVEPDDGAGAIELTATLPP